MGSKFKCDGDSKADVKHWMVIAQSALTLFGLEVGQIDPPRPKKILILNGLSYDYAIKWLLQEYKGQFLAKSWGHKYFFRAFTDAQSQSETQK